jgi:hypothetical protein
MPEKRVTRGKNLGNALRGGLSNFFEDMRKQGKTTSDIWKEIYEDDKQAFMRHAISLAPKEVEMEVTDQAAVQANTNQIADDVYREIVRGERERRESQKPVH